MDELQLTKPKQKKFVLSWQESVPVQHLLDVISTIIAKEDIQVTKEK